MRDKTLAVMKRNLFELLNAVIQENQKIARETGVPEIKASVEARADAYRQVKERLWHSAEVLTKMEIQN